MNLVNVVAVATLGADELAFASDASTITSENIEKIDSLAKEVGIEWFATQMYLEAVDLLNPYVKRFKIRELEGRKIVKNENSELFEKVLNTKKEIIISSEKSPIESKYYKNSNIYYFTIYLV